jgi:hypothetical protein
LKDRDTKSPNFKVPREQFIFCTLSPDPHPHTGPAHLLFTVSRRTSGSAWEPLYSNLIPSCNNFACQWVPATTEYADIFDNSDSLLCTYHPLWFKWLGSLKRPTTSSDVGLPSMAVWTGLFTPLMRCLRIRRKLHHTSL